VDIEEGLARLEIQQVLWTYARGVDRSDYEAMASVYHPDGTDEHCHFNGSGLEFARGVVDRTETMRAVGQHHITNITIEMAGPDDAHVESYFLAFHPHDESAESSRMAIVAGRYLDHFQRRDDAWKILSREVVMDWTREHVDGPPWPRAEGLPSQGQRKATGDASYGLFGRTVEPPLAAGS
jgi:hypothetical protein